MFFRFGSATVTSALPFASPLCESSPAFRPCGRGKLYGGALVVPSPNVGRPADGVLMLVEAMAKLGVFVNSPSNNWFDTRSQKTPKPPRTDILPALDGSHAKPIRGLHTFCV